MWAKNDLNTRINYFCTLKNTKGVFGFDYWGSIADAEKISHGVYGAKPKVYDILACLSPLYEDNLKDFCDAFGYDEDSITALKTFEACKDQDRMLRKLFTSEELERLTEIS